MAHLFVSFDALTLEYLMAPDDLFVNSNFSMFIEQSFSCAGLKIVSSVH